MTRERAIELFKAHNQSEALFRHALAVEAVMRRFARETGEDEDYWGCVGLLHDLDYERWPERHCTKSAELLAQAGAEDAFIRAVVSHGYGVCSDVEPQTLLEKTLYTVDELTGLINAAALMRPSRSVMDLETPSVKKKFKDKAFAAGVNRAVILKGCDMLGMALDEVIGRCIEGMRERAEALGLG